ncbi:MAG: type II toxin-antitoxin system RelE/ParE family toxin [Caldilineales bacterium]|nr:type II toxin-antitoxin system RelE/ParE family toxin [Caldilineales bacterium]MCW5857443.1 type II toxin-antitoxin system RelE/ParE family toxin [Caldilineales bacterium]
MKYRIDAARSRLKKELRRIAAVELEQIAQAVLDLGNEPRPAGVVQLQKDVYRIRVGDYRMVYIRNNDEKLVVIRWACARVKLFVGMLTNFSTGSSSRKLSSHVQIQLLSRHSVLSPFYPI